MKALKFILILSLIILALCSCMENKISPTDITDIDGYTTAVDYALFEDTSIERKSVDELRREWEWAMSDQEALDAMLEVCDNIMFGIPVKIIGDDEWDENMVFLDFGSLEYLFKITENFTEEKDLPEYIIVTSQLGHILEIGKEYCISPSRLYNTLWDRHIISGYNQVISRELLSDDDVKRIREETSIMHANRPSLIDAVFQEASLNSDFISHVDIVVIITVTDKRKEEEADTIYDIHYNQNELLLYGKEFEKDLHYMLSEDEGLRINCDVEVGGTYLVMLEVMDDGAGGGFVMPAARKGAVVSEKSPDYAKYKEAFASKAR